MQPAKLNYKIYQGSTFQEVFRWESETKVYNKITAINKSAPCLITVQDAPTIPIGWRFLVVGAGGMKEINSSGDSFYIATNTNIPAKTVEINQVNSLNFTQYTSGGVIEYNYPVDLAEYSARMQIRSSVESTSIIYEATTENGGIYLDNTAKTITITIPANYTASFDFETAVYSVELYTLTGTVVPFIAGNMTLIPEVTK